VRLKASNADAGDDFGIAMSLDEDALVVTAQDEDSDGVGVGAPQDPGSSSKAETGAAYGFDRDGGGWSQSAFFKAAESIDEIHFGVSASLELPGLAVSSPYLNGGRVYLFERAPAGYWSQGPTVFAAHSEAGDNFGRFVALKGDTLVVTAYFEDSADTGVDGDQLDNSAINAGAAYVFERVGGLWNQSAYLKAFNTGAGDTFGSALAFDGNTIAIGARREDSADQGASGVGEDDGAENSGAVYLFERFESTWVQTAYLKASNSEAGDDFGAAVAIEGDTLVAAGRLEDSWSGTNQLDNNATDSGAVYVFERVDGEWIQTAYLKAPNADAGDHFGTRVALRGNLLAISSRYEASGSEDLNDNSASGAGAVYLFERVGGIWQQTDYFKAPEPKMGDNFGLDLVFDEHTLVVGAIGDDSHPSGGSAPDSGAAYVFR
jgi:hypothetical protein